MFHIESLEEKLKKMNDFFSKITGLPIKYNDLVPCRLDYVSPNFKEEKKIPFHYELFLGNEEENYMISINVDFIYITKKNG